MKHRFLNLLRDWRNGDMNPVMVKELRQSVRSRFVNSIIVFFLLALTLVTGIFLFTTSINRMMSPIGDTNVGATLFGVLMVVLGIGCMLVPGYASQRFSQERIQSNPDLMFISVLTPGKIVRGKFLANLVVTTLLLSLCLPFMALSYLLRGIDLLTMGAALLILMACASVLLMLGLMAGSCRTVKGMRQANGFGMFFAIVWVGPMLLSAIFNLRHVSGFSWIRGGSDWVEALIGGGVCLACMLMLFYAFTVFALSSPQTNRHLQLRLTMSIVWFCWGVLCAASIGLHGTDTLFAWVIPSIPILFFMLLIAISEKEKLSDRVKRSIPHNRGMRILAFPFFNGPVRGCSWCFLHFALTLGISGILLSQMGASSGEIEMWQCATVIVVYAVCYCLTAGLINRILPGNSTAGAPWLIVLYFVAVGLLLPGMLEELSSRDVISWCPVVEYGNIFAVFKENQRACRIGHLTFALGWFLLLLVLNAGWFLRHIRDFVPLRDVNPELAQESSHQSSVDS